MQDIKGKKRTGKRRFKKDDVIISQLPNPDSPKSGSLYYVKELTKTEYVLYPYPSKKGLMRIPFLYIDGTTIQDDVRVYNYILMEEKDAQKVQKNRKSDSRNRSTK